MPILSPQFLSILAGFTFVLSLLLTGLAVSAARRLHLLAPPVERSSHRTPTPQVGGVGICLAVLIALFVLLLKQVVPAQALSLLRTVFCATALGLFIGLWDDIRAIAAIPKLLAAIVLACVPLFFGISFATLTLPTTPPIPLGPIVGGILTVCFLLFFINAYNFMDGVNGQSAIFALNALFWIFLTTLLTRNGDPSAAFVFALAFGPVAAAILGFLPWNFPHPRIFMGDSGSLPIGALLAIATLTAAQGSLSSFVGLSLVLSVYAYDVIYTLIRRAVRHENLFQAHRAHLYQRMLIATGWSHTRLLAFHLPFYLFTGAAALFYHIGTGRMAQAGAFLAVLLILIIYTLLVLGAEKARRAQEGVDPL